MKSEHIYLRPLLVSDAAIYKKSMDDKEIMLMTGTKAQYSIEQIETHIKAIINDETREDYAICLNETKEMIGELSILSIDQDNKSAGFRIALNNQKVIGKGFGSEATKLVIQHVFEELKLNRLQLEVFSHNPRGIRAYEKCGFVKEGVLREALFYDGTYSDEIIMSIIRKDYKK
ncbi:GNAT family protein [Vagococcus carniphilus]|uniref:GNAT family protein n=1 Tax=Vagococcus carniphilus TaxID=218144 RepID=A0AAW8U580_9ENTE|nr:GNAT family protein [Vagococcus carniphilus]MDT2832932.1 GNAT family protein [Vagococcus carniphilus]